MKWFILGGSGAEQLCLTPQRLSGGARDQPFYCHAYEQPLEAFSVGYQYVGALCSHGQLFVFPMLGGQQLRTDQIALSDAV